MSQREKIQETFRRVLRQTALRALLLPSGKSPLDVDKATADALLEPLAAGMEADFELCCEVAAQLEALAQASETEPTVELDDSLELSTE